MLTSTLKALISITHKLIIELTFKFTSCFTIRVTNFFFFWIGEILLKQEQKKGIGFWWSQAQMLFVGLVQTQAKLERFIFVVELSLNTQYLTKFGLFTAQLPHAITISQRVQISSYNRKFLINKINYYSWWNII